MSAELKSLSKKFYFIVEISGDLFSPLLLALILPRD